MGKECFCWTCADHKDAKEMSKDNELFKSVCEKCKNGILQDLKKANAKIIIERDEKAEFNQWVCAYVSYSWVFVEVNKRKYFIRGYHDKDDRHSLGQIVELIKSFIKSGFKSFWRYGNQKALKTYTFWFSLSKKNKYFYHLHGNCYEYSAAFSFESTDPNDIFNIIGYHDKISKSIQKTIIKGIDKKDIYFCKRDIDKHGSNQLRFEDWTKVEGHRRENRKPTIKIISNK